METMVSTNDGFEIAEVDLKLRGPGNLMGTQQSGFKLTNTI
jgi:ATP-dependent DNA helicase RecG